MIRSAARLPACLFVGWLCLVVCSIARAEDSLKLIKYQGSGEIIYGPMGPERSVQAALGEILHQIHGHYGDRPQVGRLFQDRSGQSLAAFFNLTARNFGGRRIAGLAMVTVPRIGQPSAAIITDDAQRFSQSVNPMLQRLNAVWNPNPASTKPSAGATGPAGGAAPLRQVNFPDGSGSIGLPSGWQLTGARSGAMEAHGPHGEKLLFGMHIPVIDTSNPRVSQRANMETQGGRRPLPGMYVAIPYGTDPGRAFISASRQLAQKQGRQAPTINLTKVTQGQSQGRFSVYVLQADLDAHDGQGFVAMTVQLFMGQPDGMGNYGMNIYQANVPKPLVAQEGTTIAAIFRSYKTNDQVIGGQVQRQIAVSTEYTNSVLARAKQSQADFDSKLASDRANQDSRNRVNQGFANILLDQSVVQDSQHNARGTISNDYADALVKANPQRFQYVPTQDYMKGIDY